MIAILLYLFKISRLKNLFYIYLLSVFFGCTSKKDVVYLQDISKFNNVKNSEWEKPNFLQINDVLKIDVFSNLPNATVPYNNLIINNQPSLELMQINGYVVSENYEINFPNLGLINVKNQTIKDLEQIITNKLVSGNHLNDPLVNIRHLNAKYTILGEVSAPGTYTLLDEKLTLLQAIGYAGDINSFGKKKEIKIIRHVNGSTSTKTLDLTSSDFLKGSYYYVKNNDIIIINPNFNKVKSSGFIGSPQTISSIASLLLSITLLIINK
tara:strand:- start:4271 stop:5071 length:801 start_codon:yes stop_codon:yes gene_type:complete